MKSTNDKDSSSIDEEIKEKFVKGIYKLSSIPRIIEIEAGGIYINRKAPFPNELESLEDMDWENDKLQIHNLKAKGYGDFGFKIGMINTKYFDDREALDSLYISKIRQTSSSNIERISIENALEHFSIQLSCDMDYYMKNKHELENDLKRPVISYDANNIDEMKKLEKELLYNQMCKIFGQSKVAPSMCFFAPLVGQSMEDDIIRPDDNGLDGQLFDKAFIIKDFKMLYRDGNYRNATARRGNYYLLFSFVY
jgi:hypothetical protein